MMGTNYFDLKKDIYFLEVHKKHIIYAPLQGVAFLCSSEAKEIIKQFFEKSEKIEDQEIIQHLTKIANLPQKQPLENSDIDCLNRLVIIPTQKCNLACHYCYAKESRSKEELDIHHIKLAIDNLITNGSDHLKVITFIGGGEPLVSWDVLTQSIDYFIDQSTAYNLRYQIRIVTNATLLTEDRISWLSHRRNIIINISSDILPEIQNGQRPLSNSEKGSFHFVNTSINNLIKYRIPFTLRSTITMTNVNKMSDMVNFVIENYPEVKRLHFEPVTDDNIDNSNFFQLYIKYFFEALHICHKNNMKLTNSYISSINHIKQHFCQGEMCIVPGNKIVACHRHSSPEDSFYKLLSYGEITDEGINIDRDQMNKVSQIRNNTNTDCQSCFAKWHCVGGCTSKKLSYNHLNRRIHCRFIRDIISRYIYYKLKNTDYEK